MVRAHNILLKFAFVEHLSSIQTSVPGTRVSWQDRDVNESRTAGEVLFGRCDSHTNISITSV